MPIGILYFFSGEMSIGLLSIFRLGCSFFVAELHIRILMPWEDGLWWNAEHPCMCSSREPEALKL